MEKKSEIQKVTNFTSADGSATKTNGPSNPSVGGFSWYIHNDRLVCSPQFLHIFEIERKEYLTQWQHLLNCVYPEDLLRFENEVSQIIGGIDTVVVPFRVATPTGIKAVTLFGDVTRDDQGDAAVVDGFVSVARMSSMVSNDLSTYVAEVIHSVNNVLTSILGSTSMASSMLGKTQRDMNILEYLDEVENETMRAAGLLRKLVQTIKRN